MLYVPGQRGIGEAIGQGFEKTIPSAVQGLIQDRLAGLQRQQYEQSVKQTGIPQNIAQLLSRAPEAERKFLWQNLDSLIRLMPQGQQGMPQGQQQAQQAAPGQQQVEQMMAQAQEAQQGQQAMPQGAQGLAQQQPQQQVQQPQVPLFENPADKRARLQLEQGEKKIALGETKKYRDEVEKKAAGLNNLGRTIGEMKELSESDKLSTPAWIKTLKSLGLDDLSNLTNPETEQYKKLETQFYAPAKDIFGARVTNFEFGKWLNAIPTLMNSKEGRNRIFNDFLVLRKAANLEADTVQRIMKENKNTPPIDLQAQVRQEVDPKMDKLFEKMSFNRSKVVEDFEEAQRRSAKRIRDTQTGQILTFNPKTQKYE